MYRSLSTIPKLSLPPESVSKLWSTRWLKPCSLGVYPFGDAKLEDFEPIFEQLRATSSDSVSISYDPDAYAAPFMPVGEQLVKRAEDAEQMGNIESAEELYLRAAVVYVIARYPSLDLSFLVRLGCLARKLTCELESIRKVSCGSPHTSAVDPVVPQGPRLFDSPAS